MDEYETSQVLEEKILETLTKSEETGEIDDSIIGYLSILRDDFKKLETYWLENGKDVENSFAMFHAAKNCSNVLQRIICRLENADREMENPTVALDSITILPSIFEIKSILESSKSETLNKAISFSVLDRVRNLRLCARLLRMLPSREEEAEGISARKSKRGFKVFSENILGMFYENQGSP